MSTGDPLARTTELLRELESARARLEQAHDPDEAIELLGGISELARQVQAELERAKMEADARP